MDDLISRKAILNEIRKIECEPGYQHIGEDWVVGLCIAESIIEEAEVAEPERRWIPVTERLPQNDTEVLVTVCDDSGDTPWEYVSVGWQTPDGQYWIVGNEICYGVIAWMPLPKPYRGE